MLREPQEFWQFYSMRLAGLVKAHPSAAHRAIAAFEQMGLTGPVITQNVDGLHGRAGSSTLEVHGSLGQTRCISNSCSFVTDLDDTLWRIEQSADGIPVCPDCQSMLRPGVVLFGEALPELVINQAFAQVEGADGLLVCGSSLEVWPVAGLVECAADAGAQIAIINLGSTAMDHLACLRVDGMAGQTLGDVLAELQD
jgi:NAD-dependent deacetylase